MNIWTALRPKGIVAKRHEAHAWFDDADSCEDADQFIAFLNSTQEIQEWCKENLPVYYHGDGYDIEGMVNCISRRKAELDLT